MTGWGRLQGAPSFLFGFAFPIRGNGNKERTGGWMKRKYAVMALSLAVTSVCAGGCAEIESFLEEQGVEQATELQYQKLSNQTILDEAGNVLSGAMEMIDSEDLEGKYS